MDNSTLLREADTWQRDYAGCVETTSMELRAQLLIADLVALLKAAPARPPEEETSVILAAEHYAATCARAGMRLDITQVLNLKSGFYAGAKWQAAHPTADVVGPQSSLMAHPPPLLPPSDPWAKVKRLAWDDDESGLVVYNADAVDQARAADLAAHQHEKERLEHERDRLAIKLRRIQADLEVGDVIPTSLHFSELVKHDDDFHRRLRESEQQRNQALAALTEARAEIERLNAERDTLLGARSFRGWVANEPHPWMPAPGTEGRCELCGRVLGHEVHQPPPDEIARLRQG